MSRRESIRCRTAIGLLPVILVALFLAPVSPASAAPLFKAPFPCGQSWTASTYSGHSNNNNAVDFNLYPGQSDLGQPALADAPGTARTFWDNLGGNMVEIDHGGGWKTWYAHLASVTIANPIDTGEQIGTVGNTTGSGTISPHLHYEQRLNGVAQSVAFDGQRIAVGTSYTPSDPKITSTNCGTGSNGMPFGYLDAASSPAPGVLRVGGWSVDPDAKTSPIEVHVYANSIGFNLGLASGAREDVGRALPDYGSNHGFSADLSLEAGGSYRVCAFGINVGPGENQPLRDCKQVSVADPRPFGHLDTATSPAPGKLTVTGWAADPNQPTSPIDIHVYVGKTGFDIGKASVRRDDVGNAVPGYGPNHGFDTTLNVPPGEHQVCAFGINVGPGSNQPLKDCRKVTVAAPAATPPVAPNPPTPPVTPTPPVAPAPPVTPAPPIGPGTSNPPATDTVARLKVKVKRLRGHRVRLSWPIVPGATVYRIHRTQRGIAPKTTSTSSNHTTTRIKSGRLCWLSVSALQSTTVLARANLKLKW